MDDVRQALDAWHDLYAASAGVAAALLGLIFIAISLLRVADAGQDPGPRHVGWRHLLLNRVRYPSDTFAQGSQTYVMFIYAMTISLLMLVPGDPPLVPAGAVVLLGILGCLEAVAAGLAVGRGSVAPGTFERVWRYWLPIASMAALVIGGVALGAREAGGLDLIAVGVGLLIVGASRNAWDLLLSIGAGPQAG